MKRTTRALLLAGLSGIAALAADLPGKWRAWRYSRPVETPAPQEGPVELTLPWAIYPHCATGCVDARLLNERGEESPYAALEQLPGTRSESRAARVVENSFVADRYTQVVGDLGEGFAAYDRVIVDTDRGDFLAWAEVALSDDAKTWRVVEPRAPIARFRARSIEGTQSISFSALGSRYLRVRIQEPSARFPVSGLRVLREETKPGRKSGVPAAFSVHAPADPAESSWTARLESPNQPVGELLVSSDSPEFYRAVRIRGSVDGRNWTYRGSGTVYRYSLKGKTRESLRITLPEYAGDRYLLVDIVNGDDQPLRNVALALFATPRSLLFKPKPGERYALIYGNERASAPEYDLRHTLLPRPAGSEYPQANLGPEELNGSYRDPRPFTERHPEVLWTALGVAILLIGLTAIKTLRDPAGGETRQTQ
jgi:Protein of unknown function (DUF3999)